MLLPIGQGSVLHAQLLDLLLAQASEHALILLDPDGRVVGWHGGAGRIFHFSAAEIVGRPLDRLFTPEDCERGMPRYELQIAAAVGQAEDDRWQLRKDGSRFWASGAVTVLRDAEGGIAGFGKILRERTDLKGQIDALNNRVEALQQADARKTVFLGKLAHELRNPLAALSNATALFRRRTEIARDLAEATGLMERQLSTLCRLAEDINDATRIAAGKVELRIEPVDVAAAVKEAVASCRKFIEERGHILEVLMPPASLIVNSDRTRLQQILTNLIGNAVKYTPRGGRIWIKGTIEGREAVIRVEDTGVGIPPDMITHVFELFTQVASSRGLAQGGLGLGLPLVKELVALHGGTVQVHSEGLGRGAEFTVRLPVQWHLARPQG
jgi:PAS domain S-box-containing protein